MSFFIADYDLAYSTEHSAGLDVQSVETVTIEPGTVKLVNTGVKLNCEAFIKEYEQHDQSVEIKARLRSSFAKNNLASLINGEGTIDIDYPGFIYLAIMNHGMNKIVIDAGTRIGQLVINPIYRIPDLIKNNKRTGGFGSTN